MCERKASWPPLFLADVISRSAARFGLGDVLGEVDWYPGM